MAMILISFPIEIGSDDLAWTKINLEQDSKKELKNDSRNSNHAKRSYGTINNTDPDSLASHDEVDYPKYVRPEKGQVDYLKYNIKESKHKIKKVTCTMIFNNIMFAIICLKIMITEQSVELGFTMIVKNFILTVLHLCYLKQMLKIYLANLKYTLLS